MGFVTNASECVLHVLQNSEEHVFVARLFVGVVVVGAASGQSLFDPTVWVGLV
jgi:hypothetical protein